MSDAQKDYLGENDDAMGEKLHMPDTLEDSDSDSDSFNIKVQKLIGVGESGNTKGTEADSSNQACVVHGNWG